MVGSLSFGFDMKDGEDRLQPQAWRAVLMSALAKSGEGLVVCDAELGVLFSTARALHFLSRLGPTAERTLPSSVASVVDDQLRTPPSRTDRLPIVQGGGAIYVHAARIRGSAPASVAIWLREEVLRDDHLSAALREKYGVSMRGFQLAQLLRQGLTNRQIGDRLNLTESTVKVYLHQLYRDCGVSSRTALVALLERSVR
jgi:DNA-binding CsgD family transcriptional regulator